MLEMRSHCECCDAALPADAAGAYICSFECTFCASCALQRLGGTCPNCSGGLQMRPLRTGQALASHPASTTRVRGVSRGVEGPGRAGPSLAVSGVRDLGPDDRPAWDRLWQGYLAFYGATLAEAVSEATWRRLLDPQSPLFGRVATDGEGRVIGFAHALIHEGTWSTAPLCYLEDLFVAPEARRAAVGRALLDDLVARCRERGWSRLYWHTQAGNAVARRLYEAYAPADDMVRYRIVFDVAAHSGT